MKTINWLTALPIIAMATPALAATDKGNDKAVWIALGVVFLGAFLTIGGGVMASNAKKKKSSDQ